MSKGKMNSFGLNEAMVCVFTSWCLASNHRPSVQSVPLGLFCHESKAHDCSWLGRSGEGRWHLLSGLVVWLLRTVGELSLALFWDEETGFVTHPTSGSWKGLSCSLLPSYSPSDSLTGWALAQVPKICSVRNLGTQSTCLQPWLWSPRAPNPATCFPGGVVDLVGWDWGWVSRGLH